MLNTVAIILGSQALFSISDIMARYYMKRLGFHIASFIAVWFLIYIFIRTAATFGQLFALTNFELGRSQTLYAIGGLLFANIIGVLLFKEILNPSAYFGIVLAVMAFIVIGFSRA